MNLRSFKEMARQGPACRIPAEVLPDARRLCDQIASV